MKNFKKEVKEMKKLNKNPMEGSVMKKQTKNTPKTSNTIFVAFFHHHRSVIRPSGHTFTAAIGQEIIPTKILDVIELISNIKLEKFFNQPSIKISNFKETVDNNLKSYKDDIQLYVRSGLATKESFSSTYKESIKYAINYIDVDIDFKLNNVKYPLDKYPEHILLDISKLIANSIMDIFGNTKFYVYPTYQGYRIALYYYPLPIEYELFENLKKYAFKPILMTIQERLNTITDPVRKLLLIDGKFEMKVDKGNAMGVLRLPLLKYDKLLDEHRLYATYMNDGEYYIDLSKWYKQTSSKQSVKTKHLISSKLKEEISMGLSTIRKPKLKISKYEEIDKLFKSYREQLETLYPELFELSKALVLFLENYKVQYYLSTTDNRRMNDIIPMIILSYILVGKSFRDLEELVFNVNIKPESFKGWLKKFIEENLAGILTDDGINESLIKQNIKVTLEWLLHIETIIPNILLDEDLIELRADVYKALATSFDKGSIVERFLVDRITNSYNIPIGISPYKYFREKMFNDLTNFIKYGTENIAYVVATTGVGKTTTTLRVIEKLLNENDDYAVIYISPFKAVNKQVEDKLIHERFKVLTYQSIIEKAYQLIKNDILPLITDGHLDITKSIMKEFNLTLRKLLPENLKHFLDKKIIFILDEIHELSNLYKMEYQKESYYDTFKIKAILYKDLLNLLTKASLTGRLSILSDIDKVITLTATPPIETYVSPYYKYILPRSERTCTVKFHRDFYKVDSKISELPTYLKEIDEKEPNKVLIYINNKRTQNKVISLLKDYYKDRYTIIGLESSNPTLTTKLKEIEENEKVIIVSTAVIRAGFDSDIDYIIFYGLPQDRDELLQVIGRNRNKHIHVDFVVSGDIPGKQIPIKFFKKYLRNIIDYIDIYYTVPNREEIPKLIELIDNSKELKKLIDKSGGTKVYPKGNDIESIVATFENSITPYSYYATSPIASIPITKLKKYRITKNMHLWDLAYELIPSEVRKLYFNHSDILLKDFIEGNKSTKKLKETTRFKKYYQSIKNVSYETLLDKFTLTLTLNSKIDNRPKLLNKLTKQILTEIQYDPYSNLYYFTNEDGYMLIPIDYNKETVKLAEDKKIIDLIGYRFNGTGNMVDSISPQDKTKLIYSDNLVAILKSGKRIYFVYKNLELLEKLFIDTNSTYNFIYTLLGEMRKNGVIDSEFMKPVSIDISDNAVDTFMYLLENDHKFKQNIEILLRDLGKTYLLKENDYKYVLLEIFNSLYKLHKDYSIFSRHKQFLKSWLIDIPVFAECFDILSQLRRTYAYGRLAE